MKDQEAVVQAGATKCCTAVEDESNNTAEQCTSDAPRAVKDGNLLEEKGKAMEQGGPVGTLGAAEYGIVVGPQEEEDVLVKGQGQDVISVQDQHKVVEQCTSDELGVAMGDSTVQDQEVVVVEQEGVTEYYDAAVEDQNNNAAVEKCSSDELRAVEDGNVVEEKKKAVDQEGAIVILGAAKDGVAVGSQEQEEGDVVIVVVAEQGEDGMSLQNQDKVVEQCTSEQLRTTMDDNAVQDHEVVEQDGAIVESGATADATAVEAQEKVLEQSAGDESRTTKDESAVEDKEKVADQEGVIDKQDANNDCSALGSKEQGDVEGGIYVQDQDKVMEQYTSDQLRTTTYDNGTEDYEVVEKGGANVERGAIADGIVVEAQEKTVQQSAGDELGATKGENVVEDKEKAVNLSVFEKQGAIMDDSALELQEELEDMVVAEQGEDGISDELRATKDENAVEDKKKVVNLGVIYRQGAIKDGSVVELQEEPEDIVVVEHGEDSISVQYHNKVVEQCTNDQLRATTDDNDVEDQEVSREKDRVCAGYPQRPGRSNCRFYMSNRNRSYGLSCYYNHPQLEAKPEVSRFPSEQGNREVAEFLELNRVGLPI
uniref:C3H1-type domain-containing protein n=1 Tax=Arundo donax TaxID=35708 RepID=A0A0A8ZLK6_ARUDO